MLKKILGLLLIICMIPVTGLAVEKEAEVNVAFDSRIEKLAYLGITFDEGIKHDESVTRVNLIRTILDFVKAGNNNTDCGFYDVDQYHPYFDEINTGANLGYMKGYQNGYFYPDKIITVDEAVKVLVCALGYDERAGLRGGFPGGYTRIAEDLGVLDGVSRTEPFTYDAFSKLLENALDAQVLEIEFGADRPKYVEIEGHDALWVFHEMTKVKAVVTANAVTGLKRAADKTGDKQYARLDDEMVYTGSYDISQYLGYSVEAYLYHGGDEDFAEVKYAELSARNTTETVKAEDILDNDSDFSAYSFVYTDENDRTKKVAINSAVSIIYNGVAKPVYSKTDLTMDIGDVTLMDNNGDGNVDCVSIFKPETIMVVDYAARDDKGIKVFDLKNANTSYHYDAEYEDYVIYIDGEESEASSITTKMVVLIGANGDHSITKAYSSKIEGKIQSMSVGNGEDTIEIDGVEYKVAPGAASAYQFKLNASGTFFVDDNLYVYGYEKTTAADEKQYGYFIEGYYSEAEETGAMEMLTADNEIEKIYFSEKVKFNGSRTEITDVMNALRTDGAAAQSFKHQVVMYELDADGKVKSLYTSVDATKGETGVLRYEGMFDSEVDGENKYAFYMNSWQNKFHQDSETICFNVNLTDLEASYASGKINTEPPIEGEYKHYFYNVDADKNTVDVVVWERGGSAASDTYIDKNQSPAVVTAVIQTINADDEPVNMLECVQDGKKIQIEYNDKAVQTVKDSFNTAKPGDIIYYAYDGTGKLGNMYIAFSKAMAATHTYGEGAGNATWKQSEYTQIHIERRSTFWKLTKKLQNNYFEYETIYIDGDNNPQPMYRTQIMNTAAKVYRVTVGSRKVNVEPISYDDVKGGDEIFTQSKHGTIQTMFVIEIN